MIPATGRIRVLEHLTEPGQLRDYVDRYERAAGHRVPTGYLRRSTVFGFRHRGRLVGGGVMATGRPFRTLERIPQPARDVVAARVDPDDTLEITCVWLDPAVRRGALSALFWYGLFLETGRLGVRTVLFGTSSPGLHRLYLCGRPTVLYEGPVVVGGVDRRGWVFLSPVNHRWPALTGMTAYKAARDLRRALGRTAAARRRYAVTAGPSPATRGTGCVRPGHPSAPR